ncbi:MAG: hypothetical protein Ct9H300mP31_09270 [Acidimicrobiaceae bacterium]|nr:MAG: hypothetical protein Ct9H300mP31_09270 [Acidimicrobiaceae bacterium]
MNVPLTYAHAYFSYAMLVALFPRDAVQPCLPGCLLGSAPEGCILNARHPQPVGVRHVIGHFVTDLCLGAIADALPDVVPPKAPEPFGTSRSAPGLLTRRPGSPPGRSSCSTVEAPAPAPP